MLTAELYIRPSALLRTDHPHGISQISLVGGATFPAPNVNHLYPRCVASSSLRKGTRGYSRGQWGTVPEKRWKYQKWYACSAEHGQL